MQSRVVVVFLVVHQQVVELFNLLELLEMTYTSPSSLTHITYMSTLLKREPPDVVH